MAQADRRAFRSAQCPYNDYHKIKKAVQQERQHQSSAAAQDTQQEAGSGDKQRISHAAAPSIACQQERNG